jgi:cytochrome c peroxidase
MSNAQGDPMKRIQMLLSALVLAAVVSPLAAQAGDTTATAQRDQWQAQAGAPASAERGKLFFNSKHGGDLSCASCHGQPPTALGKHASTGKVIEPLAPAFNPVRFTDTAKVDKWFRRNCKDVLSRECSAAEKADVLAYLVSLKP